MRVILDELLDPRPGRPAATSTADARPAGVAGFELHWAAGRGQPGQGTVCRTRAASSRATVYMAGGKEGAGSKTAGAGPTHRPAIYIDGKSDTLSRDGQGRQQHPAFGFPHLKPVQRAVRMVSSRSPGESSMRAASLAWVGVIIHFVGGVSGAADRETPAGATFYVASGAATTPGRAAGPAPMRPAPTAPSPRSHGPATRSADSSRPARCRPAA